jgi:hypothetical protein
MVEAHIHLRLLPTSIKDMYKVFEVILCCLIDIWMHLEIVKQAKLALDFEILGHLWNF